MSLKEEVEAAAAERVGRRVGPGEVVEVERGAVSHAATGPMVRRGRRLLRDSLRQGRLDAACFPRHPSSSSFSQGDDLGRSEPRAVGKTVYLPLFASQVQEGDRLPGESFCHGGRVGRPAFPQLPNLREATFVGWLFPMPVASRRFECASDPLGDDDETLRVDPVRDTGY